MIIVPKLYLDLLERFLEGKIKEIVGMGCSIKVAYRSAVATYLSYVGAVAQRESNSFAS